MRAINVLLAFGVAILIFLALFEGGLRLIGMGPPVFLNRFDSDLGWSKQPELSVTRKHVDGQSIEFEFNGSSLREDPGVSPEQREEGATRMVCLGDSFVLGFAVNREDLFVDLLENRWDAEGRQVEVLNTGTEGWSTDQEVRWLQKNGGLWAPDVVVLFPFENDLVQNGNTTYAGKPKPRYAPDGTLETETLQDPGPRPLRDSWAVPRLFTGSASTTPRTPVRGARGPIITEFMAVLNDPPESVGFDEDLAHTKGALIALQRTCEQLGARLVICPIPGKAAVVEEYRDGLFASKFLQQLDPSEWDADRPVELFLGMAGELGIETLDPRDALRAAEAASEGSIYFEKDWHLNAEGNRALAGFLYDSLEGTERIPAAATSVDGWPEPAEAGGLPGWLPWYAGLWLVIGSLYCLSYRDEKAPLAFLKVGAMIGLVFAIAILGMRGIALLPPSVGTIALLVVVLGILGFVVYKLGDRIGTIAELLKAFTLRGHWYLMPLVVVLLTVGSLLVVAASSPLVAPFIYTLF